MSRKLFAGCGLKSLPPGTVGLDYNIRYIAQNRPDSPGGLFLQGDLLHIPLRDGACNEIECWEVLEHIRDKERVIKELHRVCTDGGTLLLSTPMRHIEEFLSRLSRNYRRSVLETQHQWTVSPEETVATVSRYFDIHRIRYDSRSYLFCVLVALMMDRAGLEINDAGEIVGRHATFAIKIARGIVWRVRWVPRLLRVIKPRSFSKSIILECKKRAIPSQ